MALASLGGGHEGAIFIQYGDEISKTKAIVGFGGHGYFDGGCCSGCGGFDYCSFGYDRI